MSTEASTCFFQVKPSSIGKEIQDAAGAMQVCAGQQAGCEAAVHDMRELSHDPDTEAILLVDVTNACI